VKSAGGRENIHKEIYVNIVLTERGRNNLRLMTERNAGKNVSIFLVISLSGQICIYLNRWNSKEMSITMPDEKTMRDVVRSYSGK
jgi:hypothetical protein